LGRDEVTRTNRGAEGINSRVKFLPLAWARMPKTSFRKNSDSPHYIVTWDFCLWKESPRIWKGTFWIRGGRYFDNLDVWPSF